MIILNHWVDVLELDARLVDREAPLHLHLLSVSCRFPRLNFTSKILDCSDASGQALTAQGTQLVLGHVQPTSVFGGVMDLEPFRDSPCLCRWECFVERAQSVGIEVVHDQNDDSGIGVAAVDQISYSNCPVHSRATFRDQGLTPAGLRFGEHEDVGGSIPFVFVVDPPWTTWFGWNRYPRFFE